MRQAMMAAAISPRFGQSACTICGDNPLTPAMTLTNRHKGCFMTSDSNARASILAEAVRNAEEIHVTAERFAVRDHVARLATLRQAMILPDPAG
jgi:hypothetical protein